MLSSHYLMSIEITTGARVEEPATNEGDIRDTDLIRGLGRSPREGNGNPLEYSYLENPRTVAPGRLQSIGLQRAGQD